MTGSLSPTIISGPLLRVPHVSPQQRLLSTLLWLVVKTLPLRYISSILPLSELCVQLYRFFTEGKRHLGKQILFATTSSVFLAGQILGYYSFGDNSLNKMLMYIRGLQEGFSVCVHAFLWRSQDSIVELVLVFHLYTISKHELRSPGIHSKHFSLPAISPAQGDFFLNVSI